MASSKPEPRTAAIGLVGAGPAGIMPSEALSVSSGPSRVGWSWMLGRSADAAAARNSEGEETEAET